MRSSILRDQLPYVPSQVDLADLDFNTNKKLLSEEEISRLEKDLEGKPDGRYSKKDLQSKYGIIKLNGELYAVYKGMKHHKHIATGSSGKLKLVQSLKTANWLALKRLWSLQEVEQNAINELIEAGQPLNSTVIDGIKRKKAAIYPLLENDFPIEHDILQILGKTSAPVFSRQSLTRPALSNHILMELVPGKEVFEIVMGAYKLSPRRKLDLIISMLEDALRIQQAHMLHRDFKSENLVYNFQTNRATWIDFGFTKKLEEGSQACHTPELKGTMDYFAPEIFYSKPEERSYNAATEIYALGILMGEILGFEINTVVGKKYQACAPSIFITDYQYHHRVDSCIRKMTSYTPPDRPSIEDTLALFKEIRAEYIKNDVVEVGIIDIEEYLRAKNSLRRDFHDKLHNVDEVLLVTKNAEARDAQILQVIRNLQRAKLVLVNKVLHVPANLSFPVIPDGVEEKNITYHYRYFTCCKWGHVKGITSEETQAHGNMPHSPSFYGLNLFAKLKTNTLLNHGQTAPTQGSPDERLTF